MAPARIAPRPRDLFFALLSAAAAGHTAFLVVLTWLRPDLGVGGFFSLLLLPFIFIALGFIPVILVVTLVRVALLTLAPGLLSKSLLLTLLLAIVGIGVACGIAWMTVRWLPNQEVYSSVLFGAAVGGVFAGLKLGGAEQ